MGTRVEIDLFVGVDSGGSPARQHRRRRHGGVRTPDRRDDSLRSLPSTRGLRVCAEHKPMRLKRACLSILLELAADIATERGVATRADDGATAPTDSCGP
jgi:hypothetical protein